jgi:hypothetical protein
MKSSFPLYLGRKGPPFPLALEFSHSSARWQNNERYGQNANSSSNDMAAAVPDTVDGFNHRQKVKNL